MPSEIRDHEPKTNHRGRATVLIISLAAFAAGAVAMLLGYGEAALGLMVLALLAVVSEVVAGVVRSSRGERSRDERR